MPEPLDSIKAALRKLPKNTVKAMSAGYEKSDQVATIAYRTVVTGAKNAVGKKTDAGAIQDHASEVKRTVKAMGRDIKEKSREQVGIEGGAGPDTQEQAAAIEELKQEALERMEQSKAHVANLAKGVGDFAAAIKVLARETDWGTVTSDGGKLLEDSSKLDSLLKSWQAEANRAFANVQKGIETASRNDVFSRITLMADIQNLEGPLVEHVQLVGNHVAKLTMNAAEKSAVDVSFKKEFGWSVLFASMRVVISGAAAIGDSQVPGIGSVGEGLNMGMTRLERYARMVRRNDAIKKRRVQDGPNWAIQVLNQPEARLRVAERVCTKQKEHALTWLSFAGIAGTNLPGWKIIKLAAKTAANTYFEARVKTLEESLNAAAQPGQKLGGVAETVGDVAKEMAIEFRIEVEAKATEEIDEIAKEIGEATKEAGARASYLEKAGEVLSELNADDALEAVKGLAEDFGISVGALLIQKLGAYLLGKAQILTPAQMVTGADFEYWLDSFAAGLDDVAEAGAEGTF